MESDELVVYMQRIGITIADLADVDIGVSHHLFMSHYGSFYFYNLFAKAI